MDAFSAPFFISPSSLPMFKIMEFLIFFFAGQSIFFHSLPSTKKHTNRPANLQSEMTHPSKTKKGVAPLREKTSPQHRIASEVHPVKAKAGANLWQRASLSRHWAGSAPDRLGKKPG